METVGPRLNKNARITIANGSQNYLERLGFFLIIFPHESKKHRLVLNLNKKKKCHVPKT